jgi:hypothetical protein
MPNVRVHESLLPLPNPNPATACKILTAKTLEILPAASRKVNLFYPFADGFTFASLHA